MGKYIDADKLKVDIKKRYDEMLNRAKIDANNAEYWNGKADSYRAIYDLIDSLQQEQPESSKGKFVFPNFLYARTVDNKTIDVSYAPQSLDAVEYIKNDPTEQPEVDLEEAITDYYGRMPDDEDKIVAARHFYELGLNAKEENK